MSEPEIIEGEVTEVPTAPVTAVTVLPTVAHVQSGVGAIALLSDEEFERNLASLRKSAERARRMQKEILQPGVDYGTEPGIERPFLHKPGGETFEKAYGLATSYSVERHVGDGEETPDLEFIVHAKVHLGDTAGPVIAEGLGEASNFERKYRYQSGERTCPTCGVAAIRKGKKRDSDEMEFYCWTKKDGCGARFPGDHPELSQAPDQVERPDPWDLANTLLKMARKRAYIDGILTGTGTSGLFTQDEDSPTVRRPPGATGPATGPDGARPAQPEQSDPTRPQGPGPYTGQVEKVDPESAVRRVKVVWHPDGGKVVHAKLEVKAKIAGTGMVTAILLDSLAEAAAEGNLAAGEWVSFDGDYFEREWQAGKPKIKESRFVRHLWRFRDNAWTELSPKSAPAQRVEDDLAEAEKKIIEAAELGELPGRPADPRFDIPAWKAKTDGLARATPPEGATVSHAGYHLSTVRASTSKGTPIWSARVGVPGVGIYELVINEADAPVVGLVREGSEEPMFEEGDMVMFSGTGFSGRVIIAAIGAAK